MSIRERRQAWVTQLIAEHCGGNGAEFARRIGKDSSYLSRMLSADGTPGAKGIGERTIQAIFGAFPDSVATYKTIVGDLHSGQRSQAPRLDEEILSDALAVIRGAAEMQGVEVADLSARAIAIAYALLDDTKERVTGANIIRLVKAFMASYQGEPSNEPSR